MVTLTGGDDFLPGPIPTMPSPCDRPIVVVMPRQRTGVLGKALPRVAGRLARRCYARAAGRLAKPCHRQKGGRSLGKTLPNAVGRRLGKGSGTVLAEVGRIQTELLVVARLAERVFVGKLSVEC